MITITLIKPEVIGYNKARNTKGKEDEPNSRSADEIGCSGRVSPSDQACDIRRKIRYTGITQ